MGLLEELGEECNWYALYEYKVEKQHLSKQDEQELLSFICEKRYLSLVGELIKGKQPFSPPKKKLVNKMHSTRKRVVYTFGCEETWILKLMAYLLYRYDSVMPDNLYSFRKRYGVKRAIHELSGTPEINEMYCYKADISDYFNSIDISRLLPMLSVIMQDDRGLYLFMEQLLTVDTAVYEGKIIHEKRGIMAGCPIAPFLANVYLMELDRLFETGHQLYARYSDDIICFAASAEDRDTMRSRIMEYIEERGLTINPNKEAVCSPGETWEFLGIAYHCGVIDLSCATTAKMKGKIRRKARAIYRWKQKKKVPDDTAMKTFIRIFNNKFFDDQHKNDANDLTWSRWFFPIINTDASLKLIDAYLQQYSRYVATGRHSKANYRIDYEHLKRCEYRCLVSEYYRGLSNEACDRNGS